MPDFECSLEYGRRAEHHQHNSSKVFPLGQLLEDAQEVDGSEEVPPAETIICGRAVPCGDVSKVFLLTEITELGKVFFKQ